MSGTTTEATAFEGEVATCDLAFIDNHVQEIHMNIRHLALAALVACGATAATIAPTSAQTIVQYGPHGVPIYVQWRPEWDAFQFDRHHVILGTVSNFEPYRLQVARRNGVVQMIDLKNGTIILPTGATPTLNERVAVVGYYSRGTFIANRVLIHP